MGIDSGIDSGFDLFFAAVQSANSEQAGEDRTNEKGEQACACRREPPTKELRSSSFLTQKTSGHAQLKDGRLCKSDALVRGYSSEPAGLCLTARLLSGHKDVQDVTALLLTKPNVNYLASVGNRRPKALCACGAQDMTTHQRILRGVCMGKPKAPSVYSYTPAWLWTRQPSRACTCIRAARLALQILWLRGLSRAQGCRQRLETNQAIIKTDNFG